MNLMMADRAFLLLALLALLVSLLAATRPAMAHALPESFNRANFPEGFVFGTASSAYQYEGVVDKNSGRADSVWDRFAHKYPERIVDGSNGDIAIDFYNRYKEDVQRMKEMHLDAFRFSISWSRLIPSGKIKDGVNQKGIDFYNELINELIRQGLDPYVTLWHWDTPQALEDIYGGFLSRRIVNDFKDFADLCFREFGNRVKYWITLNEPSSYTVNGYESGIFAPGRCSKWVNSTCQAGNSATEPYIVAHNLLLAHAAAVELYRERYQECQSGKIGITLVAFWHEPYNNSKANEEAAKRAMDFMFGWFMNTVTYGDYPRIMRVLVGDRLPKFKCEESKLLKGSYDFLGLNYYTTYYAANASYVDPDHARYATDSQVNVTAYKDGKPIGEQAASDWLYIYPKGINYLLNYIKDAYKNPTIYITENGVDEANDSTLSREKSLSDVFRIQYHKDHLSNVLQSINDYLVEVKGYFAWSFADNFEWSAGYTVRFGLFYIDYKDNLRRYPKESVKWFTDFLRTEHLNDASNFRFYNSRNLDVNGSQSSTCMTVSASYK